MLRILGGFCILAAAVWAGDARRGALVLETAGCLKCHSLGGAGEGHEASGIAPDLARSLTADYTAPNLASVLWNHSPAMWDEMAAQSLARPPLTESDWEDLLAYLYSVRFFDRPTDTRRGKEVFETYGCAVCHGAKQNDPGPGKPVSAWARIEDPVTLIYQMWVHASSMKREFGDREQAWLQLAGRDFGDLAAYVQYLQVLPRGSELSLPDAASGRTVFDDKCRRCHTGQLSPAARFRNLTLLEIGAGLWNHGGLSQAVPAVSAADMRRVIAYVWELQFRGPDGDAVRGRADFQNGGCLSCHRSPATGAPQSPPAAKAFTPFSLVALGWGPGREMHRQMFQKGAVRPRLSGGEVSDLVAYLELLRTSR